MGKIPDRGDGNGGRFMGFGIDRATVQVYTPAPKIVLYPHRGYKTDYRATVLYIRN